MAAAEKEAEIRRGTWVSPNAGLITFGEYFETRWLPGRVREVNTKHAYASNYRASLKPYWGERPLREIRHSDVQAWVNRMAEDGKLSASTIVKRFLLLQLVLDATKGNSARRDKLIESNPCLDVILPAVVAPSVDVYSRAEMDALIAEMEPWWAEQTRFQFHMGLRWGELMGATVSALLPLSSGEPIGRLRVRRTILQPGDIASTGNGTRFMWKDFTKTRDERHPLIFDEDREPLARLIRDRRLEPNDRLFSALGRDLLPVRTDVWTDGVPVDRQLYRSKVWLPAVRKAGLRYLPPKSVRGAHISMLLANGVDVPTVMERVGHVNYSTTRRYTNVSDGADQRLQAAFTRAGGTLIPTRIGQEDLEVALKALLGNLSSGER